MKLIAYRRRLVSAFALLAFPVLTGANDGGCHGGGIIVIGGGEAGCDGGQAGRDGAINFCECPERPPGIQCPDHSVTTPICVTHADDTCAWDLGSCPAHDGGTTVSDGSLADVEADAASDVVDSGCGCLDVNLRFGMDGGLGTQTDASTLTPCATYAHQRDFRFPSSEPLTCAQALSTCEDAVGPADVTLALAHPDVRTAIAAAPVVYGIDPRPYDGVVFLIEVGSATIAVGQQCSGFADACNRIPAGVQALVDLLTKLDTQQLARGACKAVFNP